MWRVYTVRRQRFDKPFQTVATLPGDTDPRFIDSGLSLGEYTYALDYELANGDTGTANTEPTVHLGSKSGRVERVGRGGALKN